MELSLLDYIAFIGFLLLVIGVSLWQSRKEEDTADYFLAGRGLAWWAIGLSLIASNISTEHFVGMAGQGFKEGIGMAIASYEWIAALALVIVAFFFLPRFLKAGIYTMPEYLEYRYSRPVRTLMSGLMLLFYVSITMSVVLHLGAKPLTTIFGLETNTGIWLIGLIAGAYTIYGGLKAVVWSDIIQAAALLLGGAVITVLALQEVGGWSVFTEQAGGRLDAVLPADHDTYPWYTIFIGGMWIPNLFYWGLNQFITQRTLGAKSIREGQRGVLFGATLKLIIPLIVVLPGIAAFILYADQIPLLENPDGTMRPDVDAAFPILLKNLLPTGLTGLMLAALFGAVVSTLDSLLNSASTLFTLDFYKTYFKPEASAERLVLVGRITTGVLILFACLWAPVIGSLESGGFYEFIQLYWGYVQPGILAVFLLGFAWKRVTSSAAIVGILTNIPVYWLLLREYPRAPFLNHMGISFLVVAVVMCVVSLLGGEPEPMKLPENDSAHTDPGPVPLSLKLWAALIVLATAGLYIYFS